LALFDERTKVQKDALPRTRVPFGDSIGFKTASSPSLLPYVKPGVALYSPLIESLHLLQTSRVRARATFFGERDRSVVGSALANKLASKKGDTVLDPFGGSGTTYAVAEMKGRRWIGMELGPVEGIVERMGDLNDERNYLEKIRAGYNHLFLPEHDLAREAKGLWTVKTFLDRSPEEAEEPRQLTLDT
jgi:hypothetical protein